MPPALTANSLQRALLASAAYNFAAAAMLTFTFAWSVAETLNLPGSYIVKSLVVFLAGGLFCVPQLLVAHPFERLGPANQVTLARGALAALLAGFLDEPVGAVAALVIVGFGLAALLLDGVDGHLARTTRMSSGFGARFDMELDAFIVLLFSLLAWQLEKAGAWILLSGLLRYLFLAAAWVLPWLRRPLFPSRRRQAICVIQVSVMLAVLAPFIFSPWSDLLAAVALSLLVTSFAIDVAWLARERHRFQNEPAATTLENHSP